MGGIDQSIGPGLGGFLAFFLLACALWFLMRNMLKHLHVLNYRHEKLEQEELEREKAEQQASADAREHAGA